MIEATRQGDVTILKLVHGKANALDIELYEAIAARFNALRTTSDRAIVLTGQGRMFSAGVDLPRLIDGGAAYVKQFLPALHKLYDTVFHHPKPVIAAVNGHAIAGGCVLACCADKRIAARDGGRIGVTELLVAKGQIRQPLIDRMAEDGARVDALAEKIWTSPDTLAHVRDYVARTLKKS